MNWWTKVTAVTASSLFFGLKVMAALVIPFYRVRYNRLRTKESKMGRRRAYDGQRVVIIEQQSSISTSTDIWRWIDDEVVYSKL